MAKLEKNIFLLLTFQLSPTDKDIEDTIVQTIMRLRPLAENIEKPKSKTKVLRSSPVLIPSNTNCRSQFLDCGCGVTKNFTPIPLTAGRRTG